MNLKLKLLLTVMLLGFEYFSQSVPQGVNFQASARDTSGQILSNQNLNVTINIRENSPLGVIKYGETHPVITSKYGIFNIIIGHGLPQSSISFSDINWSSDDYFIETLIDGLSIGTSQLLSVPYALQSESSFHSNVTDSLDGFNINAINASRSLISDSLINFNKNNILEAYAIGKINSSGGILSGTNNFSITKTGTGTFQLTLNNVTDILDYIVIPVISNDYESVIVVENGSSFIIKTIGECYTNLSGGLDDNSYYSSCYKNSSFNFICHKIK